eukprot:CAMPEP_0169437712 /NCGR_PEP_ID=MMETSP1042-20121227/6274_1 /TAXON_ID=464988 /ORGANISM="Hemiselmis andersenii, Strain CCMP1180" /LENGTH=418 /DNA_ID=CAMNT_0009548503 /DNA_START=179 /DNA_END=1431 /DNA_ORIENTATION=+
MDGTASRPYVVAAHPLAPDPTPDDLDSAAGGSPAGIGRVAADDDHKPSQGQTSEAATRSSNSPATPSRGSGKSPGSRRSPIVLSPPVVRAASPLVPLPRLARQPLVSPARADRADTPPLPSSSGGRQKRLMPLPKAPPPATSHLESSLQGQAPSPMPGTEHATPLLEVRAGQSAGGSVASAVGGSPAPGGKAEDGKGGVRTRIFPVANHKLLLTHSSLGGTIDGVLPRSTSSSQENLMKGSGSWRSNALMQLGSWKTSTTENASESSVSRRGSGGQADVGRRAGMFHRDSVINKRKSAEGAAATQRRASMEHAANRSQLARARWVHAMWWALQEVQRVKKGAGGVTRSLSIVAQRNQSFRRSISNAPAAGAPGIGAPSPLGRRAAGARAPSPMVRRASLGISSIMNKTAGALSQPQTP